MPNYSKRAKELQGRKQQQNLTDWFQSQVHSQLNLIPNITIGNRILHRADPLLDPQTITGDHGSHDPNPEKQDEHS